MFHSDSKWTDRFSAGLVLVAFAALCFFCNLIAGVRADEFWDDVRAPRTTATAAGVALPGSVDDLMRQYPSAKSASDGLDNKIGLACFEVDSLKDTDGAKFYFLDDKFYQMTIDYAPARIESQGGMAAFVRKLVASLGPADRAWTGRLTWWLTANRRADFYTDRPGGQLVVTDTTLANLVDKRTKNQVLTSDVEPNF